MQILLVAVVMAVRVIHLRDLSPSDMISVDWDNCISPIEENYPQQCLCPICKSGTIRVNANVVDIVVAAVGVPNGHEVTLWYEYDYEDESRSGQNTTSKRKLLCVFRKPDI